MMLSRGSIGEESRVENRSRTQNWSRGQYEPASITGPRMRAEPYACATQAAKSGSLAAQS